MEVHTCSWFKNNCYIVDLERFNLRTAANYQINLNSSVVTSTSTFYSSSSLELVTIIQFSSIKIAVEKPLEGKEIGWQNTI